MEDQKGKEATGGTMRLGNYVCDIQPDTKIREVYGVDRVTERHRHRYECNNDYRDRYQSWGIKIAGLSPDGKLVEMVEAIDHPFFVSAQSHPEFNSRPNKPYPFFPGFIGSLIDK
jgi:CTP synthase